MRSDAHECTDKEDHGSQAIQTYSTGRQPSSRWFGRRVETAVSEQAKATRRSEYDASNSRHHNATKNDREDVTCGWSRRERRKKSSTASLAALRLRDVMPPPSSSLSRPSVEQEPVKPLYRQPTRLQRHSNINDYITCAKRNHRGRRSETSPTASRSPTGVCTMMIVSSTQHIFVCSPLQILLIDGHLCLPDLFMVGGRGQREHRGTRDRNASLSQLIPSRHSPLSNT
jgi:hypothetical protein